MYVNSIYYVLIITNIFLIALATIIRVTYKNMLVMINTCYIRAFVRCMN